MCFRPRTQESCIECNMVIHLALHINDCRIRVMCPGCLPFDGRDKAEVKRNISAGKLRPLPITLSSHATNFVMSMLEYDPARRPSAAALLQHPFIVRHMGSITQPGHGLGRPMNGMSPANSGCLDDIMRDGKLLQVGGPASYRSSKNTACETEGELAWYCMTSKVADAFAMAAPQTQI